MGNSEALPDSRERVGFIGAIEWDFRSSDIRVSEDGIVVGLDSCDTEGEGGQGILNEGFGGMIGHLFAELNEAQSGAAVDGGGGLV